MYTYNGVSHFSSFLTPSIPRKCYAHPTQVLPTYIANWSGCVLKGRQQSCQIPVSNKGKLAEQEHRRTESSCFLGWFLGRYFLHGTAPNRFCNGRLSWLPNWPPRQLGQDAYCIFQSLQHGHHFDLNLGFFEFIIRFLLNFSFLTINARLIDLSLLFTHFIVSIMYFLNVNLLF